MSAVDLHDNYESGKIIIRNNSRTATRVILVDSYANWEADPGVPKYGDAWPGMPDLKVAQIAVEGFGTFDQWSSEFLKYRQAKVVVSYSTNQSQETVLSTKDMTAELLEVGFSGHFQSSGNPVDRPMAIPIAMGSFSIPITYAIEPTGKLMSYLGMINDAGWGPDGYMYGAETVRFAGYRSRRTYEPLSGALVCAVEYLFSINPQGWNIAWDGLAEGWDTVIPKRFASKNFAGLL